MLSTPPFRHFTPVIFTGLNHGQMEPPRDASLLKRDVWVFTSRPTVLFITGRDYGGEPVVIEAMVCWPAEDSTAYPYMQVSSKYAFAELCIHPLTRAAESQWTCTPCNTTHIVV